MYMDDDAMRRAHGGFGGAVSGTRSITQELLLHLGYQPNDLDPHKVQELDLLVGCELLDLGREFLAGMGLPVRDSAGVGFKD